MDERERRQVPFHKFGVCEICTGRGVYEFEGDYICPECLNDWVKEKLEELYG